MFMTYYIYEYFTKFGEALYAKVSSPGNKGLQNINENSPRLDKQEAYTPYYMVAKLLWVAKNGRPDIEPEMSFLCIRLTKSTVQYKATFKRVIQFLKQTINDKRVVGSYNLSQLYTWSDSAYSLYPYLKIHTGRVILFGYGLVHCRSSKKKFNTKSSTEDETGIINDYLPYNIQICLFMEAQGCEIKQNIIFQDNQSVISMEENGKRSFTNNYRNIYMSYFFVKDHIDSNYMPNSYCSTEHMLAYFFTKALHGVLFF